MGSHLTGKIKGGSRPVSRILYPGIPGGGHPSGTAVTDGLLRPTRASSAAGHGIGSYLALLREGFTKPAPSPGPLVGSYPTFSPLPAGTASGNVPAGGFPFCGTFRRVAPPGRYPAPCPVESGLSSSRKSCPRPPGQLPPHTIIESRRREVNARSQYGFPPVSASLRDRAQEPRWRSSSSSAILM